MSLAEKWEEYQKTLAKSLREKGHLPSPTFWDAVKSTFYAGAEAVLPVAAYNADLAVELQAEIDRFKGQK